MMQSSDCGSVLERVSPLWDSRGARSGRPRPEQLSAEVPLAQRCAFLVATFRAVSKRRQVARTTMRRGALLAIQLPRAAEPAVNDSGFEKIRRDWRFETHPSSVTRM